MNNNVLKEVSQAYCDSTIDWSKAVNLRQLDFHASQPVGRDEAVEIMTKALGLKDASARGYNEFSPDVLNKLPVGSQVTLAREGSVCVYVTPVPQTNLEKLRRRMRADECDLSGEAGLRIWWD